MTTQLNPAGTTPLHHLTGSHPSKKPASTTPAKSKVNTSKINAKPIKLDVSPSPNLSLEDLLKVTPPFPVDYKMLKMLSELKNDIEKFCIYTSELIKKEQGFVESLLSDTTRPECVKNRLVEKYQYLKATQALCTKINRIAQKCFELKCSQPENSELDRNKSQISAKEAHEFGCSLRIINLYLLIATHYVNITITVPREVLENKKLIPYKTAECYKLAENVMKVADFYSPYAFYPLQTTPPNAS